MFDFLCFQPSTDRHANAFLWQRPDLFTEVVAINEEIGNRQGVLHFVNGVDSSIASQVGFDVMKKLSLQDVFGVVDKVKYPLLWRETMKLRTIIPTTVCCEQSFSVVKHSLHHNMKNETVIAVVTTKYQEKSN